MKLFFLAAVALCLIGAPLRAAQCSGDASCRVCSNCKYCKHCAKLGGHCRVCSHSSTNAKPKPKKPTKKATAAKRPTARKR